MPRKGWKWLVFALGLGLSVFLLGASAFGGDAIETKPGGLPVAKEQGDLTDLARHLNNPVNWSRTAGLGDITLEPFLVPQWKPWLIFGVAPSLIMPAATDPHLGQGKVQLGPVVVVGFLTKQWIGGVFVQNWWSLAGHNAKPVVNQMNLQYFLYRMLPDAWQVGFAPMSW
jgi:hypothetical protein